MFWVLPVVCLVHLAVSCDAGVWANVVLHHQSFQPRCTAFEASEMTLRHDLRIGSTMRFLQQVNVFQTQYIQIRSQ